MEAIVFQVFDPFTNLQTNYHLVSKHLFSYQKWEENWNSVLDMEHCLWNVYCVKRFKNPYG